MLYCYIIMLCLVFGVRIMYELNTFIICYMFMFIICFRFLDCTVGVKPKDRDKRMRLTLGAGYIPSPPENRPRHIIQGTGRLLQVTFLIIRM